MFSLEIVDTDAFLDMPNTSQLLYFHLSMRADDEGFVSNPKKIMKLIGSQEDDYKVLLVKRFILPFKTGVCVIKHWLIHNTIRLDRYKKTNYIEEKALLSIKSNNSYTERQPNGNQMATKWQPNGNQMATKWQPNISKIRLDKINISKDNIYIENLISKYLEIKDIKNKTNQQYISKLSKKYTEQEIEFLLKGIIYFNEKDPQYAYVIESVRSLWNKREKIILRLKKEEIYLKNKKGGIAVI